MGLALEIQEKNAFAATVLIAVLLTASGGALGQASNTITTTPTSSPGVQQIGAAGAELTEIVVTAEKVESTAQRTAASLDVVDSAALARQQIVEFKDLNSLLPNAQIVPVVNSLQITIRGIGSDFIDPRADPGVAASLNGLYFDRPLPNGFAFLDVARVEVLNGPQGTLYGRNAAAGALNIVTNMPSVDKFSGMAQVTYGALNEKDFTAVLNIPIADTFAFRIAYQRNRRDGYNGDYYDDVDSDTTRVSARWTPTDKLSVYLESDYLQTGGHGAVSTAWACPGAVPWSTYYPKACSTTGIPGSEPDTGQTATFVASDQVHVDYNFDWVKLTSISGFVGTHQRYYNLPNGILFNETEIANSLDYSQEFRLSGYDNAAHRGGFAWQAGAYYFDSSGNYNLNLNSPAFGPPTVFTALPQLAVAGFAQASYGLTDALRVTAGARYTEDHKGLTDSAGSIETRSNRVTYKGGLEYDLASDKMLYANVSTGYVAGGVNGGSLSLPVPEGVASPTFKPETITAYEVGSKNRFLDNRLQLNGDFYYYDFHNYQLTNPAFLNNNPLANVLVIDNVGQVTTYGFELNVDFAITAEDRLSAAVTRAHGTFGALNIVTAGGNPVTGFYPSVVTAPDGSPLVNLPEWSALLGYQHTWSLNGGSSIDFSVNSKISDKYPLIVGSYAQDDTQRAYTMTDASVSYHWPSNRYVLRGWVKNIENSPVDTYGQLAGFHNYGILPPRTYGLTVTANF